MTTRIGIVALALSALAVLSPSPAESWTFFSWALECSGDPDSSAGAPYCDVTNPTTGVRATTTEEGGACKATVYCSEEHGSVILTCYAAPDFGDGPGLCAAWASSNGHNNCKSDYGFYGDWCGTY
jgi:hypothetical protein